MNNNQKNLILRSSGYILLIFLLTACHHKFDSKKQDSVNAIKHKGIHLFGIRDSIDFEPIKRNNVEWITMVSWAFQKDFDSAKVNHHRNDSSRIDKHNAEWSERISKVRDAGFKVFLKPHLWIHEPSDGKWRSDVYPSSDENWSIWMESYRDFILRYATIAQNAEVEMFCIGTEFSRLTIEKPEYWKQLIAEVREVYDGEITYAANWYKEYEEIEFWDQLDYVGIQAYFPLVNHENPTIDEISEGWKKYIPSFISTYKKHNKSILFTELGYKSTTASAIRPWEWIEDSETDSISSVQTQANCYQAFYNSIWNENWFAGAHLWQFRTNYDTSYRHYKLDFTPQGKPAEETIRAGFQ